ncbi:MAG: hypothetical protein M3X11_20865 [Acidobacteriota bacterium]|nr:hypothetical protein [Acidobacteriota bacterium]
MHRMNDTPPEIADLVRERLMARSGAERVAMGSRMFDAARAIALASFPPGLSEIKIKARLCERMYGEEVDLSGFVAHLRAIREAAGRLEPPA